MQKKKRKKRREEKKKKLVKRKRISPYLDLFSLGRGIKGGNRRREIVIIVKDVEFLASDRAVEGAKRRRRRRVR